MEKLLTLILALAVLATFSGLAIAETKIKSTISNGSLREAADPAFPKQMTGTVTEVNNQAKTVTVMIQGKAVTFSAAKLKASTRVGANINFTENPAARFKYPSCEACNGECPGVCFLVGGGDYCRCYLF